MSARACLALGLWFVAAPTIAEAQTIQVDRIRGRGGRLVERRLTDGLVEAGFTESDDPEIRIRGRVRRRGRAYLVQLELERGGDVGRVERRGRDADEIVAALVEEIRLLIPPPEPEPPPEPDPVEPVAAATDPRPRAPADPPSAERSLDDAADAIELAVGGGVVGRAQSFTDDLFDRIGAYRLDAAPFLAVRGRWLPLRHASSDPWLGVGVQASAWTAVGLATETTGADEAQSLETTLHEVTIGLFYRMPIVDPIVIEPSVDYAESTFLLSAPGPAGPDGSPEAVPDVVYRQIRPRVAAEVALPLSFAVRAEVAWLAVLSAGRLDDADWFPRSSTNGVELVLAASWRFDRWFGARVYVAHARYVSTLSPEPGDSRVAGGALDEWTRGGLELSVFVPGAP